jgi:SAM-dependent methyltransferase
VTALFGLILLLAGALLVLVQPMFARMVLPLAGGAPAVWNTVMVCYQVLLLAGYLYAHASTRWLTPSRQAMLHVGLLTLAMLVLPIAVPRAAAPPAGDNPSWWVMAALLTTAGAPFLVVATTSPLIQTWYARLRGSAGANPYALYAASNAGSLLGLLGYPLLLEPWLTLRQQSRLWAAGYVGLALLVAAAAARVSRAARTPLASAPAPVAGSSVRWRQRARWVLLAFVPSSLMLSVTMHLSLNIAPVPLLWVVPLMLYLGTFIVAFAVPRGSLTAPARALPVAIVPVMVAVLADLSKPVWAIVALHLVSFTIVALVSHAALADDAPPAESLTEFYLWLSVGGACGGLFNAIVAPLLFVSILEYPLVLVVAGLSLQVDRGDAVSESGQGARARWLTRARAVDVVLPLLLIPMVVLCDVVAREFGLDTAVARRIVALGAPALICYVLAGRRLRFGLGVASLVIGSFTFERSRQLLVAERSFFGITRVYVTGDGRYHSLVHGNISHGAQSTEPARRREPLSYYTRSGPVGELIIPRQRLGLVRRVAVVGLGAGTLACYRQPGEAWTFFEIDAAVLRIARDPRLFTYLRDCAPEATVVLGDARRSLVAAPDDAYDLLLLDAYSADAIPVHLLTREALALYRRKLAPGGVIALHISNQYFDLAPVVAALARDAGMVSRFRDESTLAAGDAARGKNTSDWIVVAERESDLGTLLLLGRWAEVRPATSVWTDDFSSALSAMR